MISIVPDIRSVVSETFNSSKEISSVYDLWLINQSTESKADDYVITTDIDASVTNPDDIGTWLPGPSTAGDYIAHNVSGTYYTYYCLQNTEEEPNTTTENWQILWQTSKGWTPIGTTALPFTGRLSGYGLKTISNLYINNPINFCGLFGYCSNAYIENIKVKDCSITASSQVGALSGVVVNSTITRCSSTGAVNSSGQNCGGLIAYASNSNITQSYSNCNVYNSSLRAGGFIAQSAFNTITNCYATGSVNGVSPNWAFHGGFVGSSTSSGITKCYSTGRVYSTVSSGGFCGTLAIGSTITDCFYDRETSGKIDTGKGIAKSTSQMKIISSYTDLSDELTSAWDFQGTPNDDASVVDIWTMGDEYNSNYPYLLNNNDFVPMIAPTIVLLDSSTIKDTSFKARGQVTDWGGGTAFTAYFAYTVSGESSWTETEPEVFTKVSDTYEKIITGLTAETSYDVQFIVTYDEGSSESDIDSTTTLSAFEAPTVENITDITLQAWSITPKTNITSFGTYDYVDIYLQYAELGDWANDLISYTAKTRINYDSDSVEFEQEITGLTPSTSYQFGFVYEYGVYGEVNLFEKTTYENATTEIIQPTFDLQETTQIGISYATLNANLLSLGSYDSVDATFYYRAGEATYVASDTQILTSTGAFNQPISGLNANTAYDVKLVLDFTHGSDADSVESEYDTYFTTADADSPIFTLYDVSNVDLRTATFNGELVSLGSYDSATVWFEYKKISDSIWTAVGEQVVSVQSSISVTDIFSNPFSRESTLFSHTIDTLVEGVAYEVRGVVQYGAESIEAYSAGTEPFTTVILNSTVSIVNITNTTCKLNGKITNFGTYIQEPQASIYFRYKKTSDSIWIYTFESESVNDTDSATFTYLLTGLEVGTSYDVQTVLSYSDPVLYKYSATSTFLTSEDIGDKLSIWNKRDYILLNPFMIKEYLKISPSYTLSPVTNITLTTATVSLNVTNLGSYDRPEDTIYVRFRYKLASLNTWTYTTPQLVTGTGTFTDSLTALENDANGVEYDVQGGINYTGLAYVYFGDEPFNTLTAQAPAGNTVDAGAIKSTSVRLYGEITSLGSYSSVFVYFRYTSDSVNWTTTNIQEITSTSLASAYVRLLSPETLYTYQMILTAGDIYDEGDLKTFTTKAVALSDGVMNRSYGFYSSGYGNYGSLYGFYNNTLV